MKKSTIFILSVPVLIVAFANLPVKDKSRQFHSAAELAIFRQFNILHRHTGNTGPDTPQLPIDSSILFPTAKTCGGCHGYDPNHHALITNSDEDVNIYDDWRSTMMANSARDPFWRAKVRHEILVNPAHSLELQDKCTSCHAPAGHYQAKLHDHLDHYGLANLYADTLGLDGVTCQACHAQSLQQLGQLNSGMLNFDTNHIRVAYGPYEQVFAPPMHNFVGITPVYGDQILDGGLCAGCHTLITGTVDLNGVATGNRFVEQATYHEWLNSRYTRNRDNITCQKCHVPEIPDEVIISANYQFLTPRFPFGVHELAGANVTMLGLLRDHRDQLGITAKAEHFDSTIAATKRMLQQKAVDMSLEPVDLNGDTLRFKLVLHNKAGHKFPSGYPSRRAWVEFELKDAGGQSMFHSGRMNPDYSLPDEDANFEPHYQVISDPAQVQIYEMVPGDVAGHFTNILERGNKPLKDNRLTPEGFTTGDLVYDTTRLAGNVLSDPDFNRNANGTEGSGTDILYFAIPNPGYTGQISVSAKLWYQSLPPKWMAPLFEYSAPEIDSFKTMYDAADKSPVLVSSRELNGLQASTVSTHSTENQSIATIQPTLSMNGWVYILPGGNTRIIRVAIWDSAGREIWKGNPAGEPVQLPAQKGVYWIRVETSQGALVKKVVRG